jgi:SAM-dependent methyltransferase
MTFPFWAPTSAQRVEQALDLAGLRPGERFVDLGCGDGRVILAAARRGAQVTGIEIDPRRAEQARELLRQAGYRGKVVVGDVARTCFSADVVFAFLTPATLQRLAPVLGRLTRGTRLVCPEFGVEGWQPDRIRSNCFLYRTPPRPVEVASPPSWEAAGVLAAVRAASTTLIAVRMIHPGGLSMVHAVGPINSVTTVAQGVDLVDEVRPIVVDLEWKARPAGTVVAGALACANIGLCQVYAVYTHGAIGVWYLADRSQCDRVAALLADGDRSPESVLDAFRDRTGLLSLPAAPGAGESSAQ